MPKMYHSNYGFYQQNDEIMVHLFEYQLSKIRRQVKIWHVILHRRPGDVVGVSAFAGGFIKIGPPGNSSTRRRDRSVFFQYPQGDATFYRPGYRIIDGGVYNLRQGVCNLKRGDIFIGKRFSLRTVVSHKDRAAGVDLQVEVM